MWIEITKYKPFRSGYYDVELYDGTIIKKMAYGLNVDEWFKANVDYSEVVVKWFEK